MLWKYIYIYIPNTYIHGNINLFSFIQIYKSITLPLTTQQNGTVAKPEAQEILHAVEELYFFRRYTEGVEFVRQVIGNGDGDGGGRSCALDDETKSLLRYYGERCQQRIASLSDSSA